MKIQIEDAFITDNSLEVLPGDYFLKTNSNLKYLNEAIKKGAIIVDANDAFKLLKINKEIKIIGITGTNGKTTTAAAIYSGLLDLGYKVGLAGTRGCFINNEKIDPKNLTTAFCLKNLSYLQEATKQGCDFFVMEVSSHAIDQNRIDGLTFALKVFTNLTQDHLDYHKTFEEYIRVKSSFFSDDSKKIINIDDGKLLYDRRNAYTYSIKSPATFMVKAYGLKNGIDAIVKTPDSEVCLESPLVGEFNLYNILAAFSAIKVLTNKKDEDIAKALSNFGGVEGRVEVVNQTPLIIVDFAHTPDGIEKVLSSLKTQNLITVFGAGGDRDRTKRPIMGNIVQKYSKISIVTSDNPRTENPNEIIKEILSGMVLNDNVIIEPDRKLAIKKAISIASDEDVIAILGKGDEDYQEINGVKHHFSDKECVQDYFKKR